MKHLGQRDERGTGEVVKRGFFQRVPAAAARKPANRDPICQRSAPALPALPLPNPCTRAPGADCVADDVDSDCLRRHAVERAGVNKVSRNLTAIYESASPSLPGAPAGKHSVAALQGGRYWEREDVEAGWAPPRGPQRTAIRRGSGAGPQAVAGRQRRGKGTCGRGAERTGSGEESGVCETDLRAPALALPLVHPPGTPIGMGRLRVDRRHSTGSSNLRPGSASFRESLPPSAKQRGPAPHWARSAGGGRGQGFERGSHGLLPRPESTVRPRPGSGLVQRYPPGSAAPRQPALRHHLRNARPHSGPRRGSSPAGGGLRPGSAAVAGRGSSRAPRSRPASSPHHGRRGLPSTGRPSTASGFLARLGPSRVDAARVAHPERAFLPEDQTIGRPEVAHLAARLQCQCAPDQVLGAMRRCDRAGQGTLGLDATRRALAGLAVSASDAEVDALGQRCAQRGERGGDAERGCSRRRPSPHDARAGDAGSGTGATRCRTNASSRTCAPSGGTGTRSRSRDRRASCGRSGIRHLCPPKVRRPVERRLRSTRGRTAGPGSPGPARRPCRCVECLREGCTRVSAPAGVPPDTCRLCDACPLIARRPVHPRSARSCGVCAPSAPPSAACAACSWSGTATRSVLAPLHQCGRCGGAVRGLAAGWRDRADALHNPTLFPAALQDGRLGEKEVRSALEGAGYRVTDTAVQRLCQRACTDPGRSAHVPAISYAEFTRLVSEATNTEWQTTHRAAFGQAVCSSPSSRAASPTSAAPLGPAPQPGRAAGGASAPRSAAGQDRHAGWRGGGYPLPRRHDQPHPGTEHRAVAAWRERGDQRHEFPRSARAIRSARSPHITGPPPTGAVARPAVSAR